MNQSETDLGIVNESQLLGFGISGHILIAAEHFAFVDGRALTSRSHQQGHSRRSDTGGRYRHYMQAKGLPLRMLRQTSTAPFRYLQTADSRLMRGKRCQHVRELLAEHQQSVVNSP